MIFLILDLYKIYAFMSPCDCWWFYDESYIRVTTPNWSYFGRIWDHKGWDGNGGIPLNILWSMERERRRRRRGVVINFWFSCMEFYYYHFFYTPMNLRFTYLTLHEDLHQFSFALISYFNNSFLPISLNYVYLEKQTSRTVSLFLQPWKFYSLFKQATNSNF